MLQILVPTDLSRDARPGMRFAIQWSRQQAAKLLFTYVLNIPRLTTWTDEQYKRFATSQRARSQRKLEQLVADMYAQAEVPHSHYECRVIEGTFAEPTLTEYCRHHPDIDLVCMSTHGATGVKKLFGTHAGNMVAASAIPVVVVPKGYRTRPLKSILYATDLVHYEEELRKVATLAASFKASVDILHIVEADERTPNNEIFEKVLTEEFHYPVHIHCPPQDETRSMSSNIRRHMQALKPSLAVLFTAQNRTLFEKLFFPSKSESVAYGTPVPLMVFPKKSVSPQKIEHRSPSTSAQH